MTKVRLIPMTALAACALLAAGCKSLAGASCLKAPPEADLHTHATLRIPVGLDGIDTTDTLKVPPLINPSPPPAFERCLEDPPLIQVLPDLAASEKEKKKAARKEARKARATRQQKDTPGPRLNAD